MRKHHSSVKLHPGLRAYNELPEASRVDLIKAEQMFFRASPDFAELHGGELTMAFLIAARRLWGSLDGCIVDSRHHMLMPGMIPCIPGWHTDDAPRDLNRWSGQPNIFNPEYETEHLLCIVDAGTESLTEFITGNLDLPQNHFVHKLEVSHTNFYKTADSLIERFPYAMFDAPPEKVQVQSGQLAEFNVHSWHRGQPAKSRGFRWFIRITRGSRHEVQNEIRSNAQVYITDSSYGW